MARLMSAAFAACLGVMLLFASNASADTIFFSNPAAWNSAVSAVTTDDYESYGFSGPSGDRLASAGSVTLGGNTYTFREDIFGVNSTAVTYDAAYLSGSYLEWQVNPGGGPFVITLARPTTAAAFNYGEFYGSNRLGLTISLGNGDSTIVTTPFNAYGFLGAVSTVSFDTITIQADNNFPLIDNLSVAAAPVPEPGCVTLLAVGLAGLSSRLRRRR